jgi:hypothetical protein
MIKDSLFFIVLLFILWSSPIDARLVSGRVLLTGSEDLIRLTKFAITKHVSGSSFSLDLSIPADKGMYTDERNLKVYLFSEDHKGGWKSVKKLHTCASQTALAVDQIPVVFDMVQKSVKQKKGKRKVLRDMNFWEAHVEFALPSRSKTNYWYIAIGDCSLEYKSVSIKDAPAMEYTLTIMNGNSHLSADELGMTKLHILQIAISTILLLYLVFKILKTLKEKQGAVHIALLMVASALLCDISSAGCELIHQSVYIFNGIGSYSFDCLASHFEAQCDAIVAMLLLMVGSGWTLPNDIVHLNTVVGLPNSLNNMFSSLRSPIQSIKDLKRGNRTALFIVSFFISHAVLAQWGRTYDAEFDSFHSLENQPGRLLMYTRISLGIAFFVGVASVRNGFKCTPALKDFLHHFQIVGLLWFLSLPFVSWYCTKAMHPHQRHFALSLGSAIVQSGSLMSLVWLFTADGHSSAYHRISSVSSEHQSLSLDYDITRPSVWKFGKAKVRLD